MASNWAINHALGDFIVTTKWVVIWIATLVCREVTSSVIWRWLSERLMLLLAIEVLTCASIVAHVKVVLNA